MGSFRLTYLIPPRRLKLIRIATLLALLTSPYTSFAQEQPDEPARQQSRDRRMSPQMQRFDREIERWWPQVIAFAQEHMPARYRAMTERLGDVKQVRPIRHALFTRYVELQRVRERDPQLYQLRVKQLHIEDAIFAETISGTTQSQSREQQSSGSSKREDLVRQAVEASLEEREYRLENLQASVNEQRKRLAEDKANKDQLVQERSEELRRDGPAAMARRGWWFDPERMKRHDERRREHDEGRGPPRDHPHDDERPARLP